MKKMHAHSVVWQVCEGRLSVGIDFCDEDGVPCAHAHLDADTALAVAQDFHNAIADLLGDTARVDLRQIRGTRH